MAKSSTKVKHSVNPTSTSASLPRAYPDIDFVEATLENVGLHSHSGTGSRTGKRVHLTREPGPSKKRTGRNLVVCIDGTANQFSEKNTHVVELYSRLVADEDQLTYYDSGIGTYVAESNIFVRAMQWIENTLDMAIALHHKRITLSAYQWLSENYIRGDRIYLFGFSRGAYQVRIIAGMIEVIGLLRKGNNNQIPAYQLYLAMMKIDKRGGLTLEQLEGGLGVSGLDAELAKVKAGQNQDAKKEGIESAKGERLSKLKKAGGEQSQQTGQGTGESSKQKNSKDIVTQKLCKQFKKTLGHQDVRVHFVGVWDTVSSIGFTRGTSLPETTNGMAHVRAFRHALALHELRSKFLPEYGNGGAGPVPGLGDVKEVWFAGSHSDIGGGNAENLELNTFDPALRWMLYEALDYGLRVEPYGGGWGAPVHNPSMTPVWRILEAYPWKRLAYNGDATAVKRWLPHMSGGRRIQPGQLIHQTALEYLKKQAHNSSNRTRAKILHEGSWVPIQDNLNANFLPIERDSQSKIIGDAIRRANKGSTTKSARDNVRRATLVLLTSDFERQALADHLEMLNANGVNSLLDILQSMGEVKGKDTSPELEATRDTLCKVLAQYRPAWRPADYCLRPALYRSLRFTDSHTQSKVMRTFSSMIGHTNTVRSVAYSPDRTTIASGSKDRTVRLWDAKTGQPIGAPLTGDHIGEVWSIAFSHDVDGKYIVSSSGLPANATCIWNTETHQGVRMSLSARELPVRSVAFSPDSKLIALGSYDHTIQIRSSRTGGRMGGPLRGHTSYLCSVVFSPNGRYIASGSDDKTVRIWNVENRRHDLVRVLQGHESLVRSVCFSPDNKYIVSGSEDRTIRVWDANTGQKLRVLVPLREPRGRVLTVAVSPDMRYIASGSTDHTVRLWDFQTGQVIGKPLKGHTNSVRSVAFSHDSAHIISGSEDKTILIWAVES